MIMGLKNGEWRELETVYKQFRISRRPVPWVDGPVDNSVVMTLSKLQ